MFKLHLPSDPIELVCFVFFCVFTSMTNIQQKLCFLCSKTCAAVYMKSHSFACQSWCVINGKCIHLCQWVWWNITFQKFLSPDILCTSHHFFVPQLLILIKESTVPKHSNLINCELWQNMQATLITKKMGSSNVDLSVTWKVKCILYSPVPLGIVTKYLSHVTANICQSMPYLL